MKCPIDQATLLIRDKDGIEIDYCPECRGVWLDRGELEKLLEADKKRYQSYHSDEASHSSERYPSREPQQQQYHKRKKRKSMLEEVFDIF